MRKLTLFKSLLAGLFLLFCVGTVQAQQAAAVSNSGGFTLQEKTVKNEVAAYKMHNPNLEESFANVLDDANAYLSLDMDALFTSYSFDPASRTVELVVKKGVNVTDETVTTILDALVNSAQTGVKVPSMPAAD